MKFVGQTVPHGYRRICRQLLHDPLPVAPILNPVEHAGKHPRRVGDALLFPDLRTRGVKIGRPHAEIPRGDLKTAAGARTGLFKDQRNVLPLAQPMRLARLFLRLQRGGKRKQTGDLLRRKIQELQKILTL